MTTSNRSLVIEIKIETQYKFARLYILRSKCLKNAAYFSKGFYYNIPGSYNKEHWCRPNLMSSDGHHVGY
jgi:hypothetical protein